jgi:hypothetical protein
MKLPNGKDVNGLWVVLAILILACLLALIPHSLDKYGTKATTEAAPSLQQGVQA